jgi:hypothetical protein
MTYYKAAVALASWGLHLLFGAFYSAMKTPASIRFRV